MPAADTADLTPAAMADAIARAKSNQEQVSVSDRRITGLRFRASYGGSATFSLVYRPRGERKVRRIELLRLDDTSAEGLRRGLAKARTLAEQRRGKVAEGKDPLAEQRAERAERERLEAAARAQAIALSSRRTVRDLAEAFLHEKRDARWVERYRQMLRLNLLEPVPGMPTGIADKFCDELTTADLDAILRGVIERQEARRERQRAAGKPVPERQGDTQAARVFEVLRAMVRFGAKKQMGVSADILGGVSKPKDGGARKRFLTVDELRKVWNTLRVWDEAWAAGIPEGGERPPIPHNAVRVLRLQLLTACRSGELSGLRKHEISRDGFELTIPEERSKNGLAHLVPLVPEARRIIAEAVAASEHDDLVFPVRARDGTAWKPLRSDVISSHVVEMQGAFAFKDARGKDAPFCAHDLRRTVNTYLSKLGVPPEVQDAVLNHKPSGVTAEHYNLHDHRTEKREALTRWQAALDSIAEGADPFAINTDSIEALEARIMSSTRGFRVVAGGRS